MRTDGGGGAWRAIAGNDPGGGTVMRPIQLALFILLSYIPLPDSSYISYAAESSIYPTEDTIAITVPYGSDKGERVLNIRNRSGKDVPAEISTSELKQDKTGKKAGLHVLCGSGKDGECVAKKSGDLSLRVQASGINGYEQYAGIITVAAQGKKYAVRVGAQKSPPPPAVELVGSEKGKLEITRDSQGRNSFNLIFRNPDAGVFRTLQIRDFSLEGDVGSLKSDIRERTFSLEPGREKLITVTSVRPLSE